MAAPPRRADTRAAVRAEIQKMLGDKTHPLMNLHHPDHGAALRRYHELLAQL